MKRKLLTTAVAFLVSAACGYAAPVTINALFPAGSGYSQSAVTAATREFETANPNVKVVLSFVPAEQLGVKVEAEAKTGGLDVAAIDASFMAKYAQGGLLKAVPQLSPADQKDIFEALLSAASYKEKSYGMPWANDCKFLYYNRRILQAAGFKTPPATWEELIKQAKAVQDKKFSKLPIVWSWSQTESLVTDFVLLSAAFGGSLANSAGRPSLKAAGNRSALDFMTNSIENGLSNPASKESSENEVASTFMQGATAFALNWSSMYAQAKNPQKSKAAKDVAVALVPGTGTIRSATVNGGRLLSICAGSRRDKESWLYIQHLSSKQFQKRNAAGVLPVWKSLYDDPAVLAANPLAKLAKDQLSYLVNKPILPYYPELSKDLRERLEEVLRNIKNTSQGLTEAQAVAIDIADKYE